MTVSSENAEGSTPSPEAQETSATPPPESRRGGRVRRALARIGAGLGLGVVFVASLAGGAVLHIDLPASRRQIERVVRSVLDGVFEGSVEARGFEHLGLDGVAIHEVVVRDPTGAEVLRARGVRAEASVPTILRSVLGSGDLRLGLPFVRIEELDARIEPNDRGQLSIAAAFSPRAKAEPPGPERPVYVTLDHVELGAGHAHGKPDGVHIIDADLRHLTGSMHLEPGSIAIDVLPTGITETAALGALLAANAPAGTPAVAAPSPAPSPAPAGTDPPQPPGIAGTADFHLRLVGPRTRDDTTTPSRTSLWASFGGRAGDIEILARAVMDGSHVELTAAAPRVRPEDVKVFLPQYPLTDTVALNAEVKGDLPQLDFRVTADTEHSGSASADGRVRLGKPLVADVAFHTEGLDPRAVAPTAPAIFVSSRGKVHAKIGTLISVRVEAETQPTTLAQTPIPAVSASAVFDGFVWTGKAHIDEPGAPIDGTFSTQKDGAVRFDVYTRAASLAKVPRLAGKLSGTASVRASGVVRDGTLDAAIQGSVGGLRAGPSVHVQRGTVSGHLRGPFDALTVQATITAEGAQAGGYGVQDARVSLSGPITRPFVSVHARDMNDNQVDVSASIDVKGAAATGVKLSVKRDGAVASGRIARIGSRGGGVAIEGVALDSPEFGKVDGSLRVAGGEIIGSLHARSLDLGALRKLLGLTRNLSGRADVDVTLTPARGGRNGSVRVAVREGAIDATPGVMLTGVSADLSATFEGGRVSAGGEISLAGRGGRCTENIASVRLAHAQGQLEGALLDGATWSGAAGTADVYAIDWDLACLRELAPIGLPISEIWGIFSTQFSIERKRGDRFPSVHNLTANTRYLQVVGPDPEGSKAPPWTSRDIDLELTADLDADTGQTSLTVSLADYAPLVDLSLSTTLDLDALADPARRTASLRAAPVAGHVSVPRRAIEGFKTLPSFARDKLPSMVGEARIDAYVTGSVAAPTGVVRVTGWRLAPGPATSGVANPWALPLDVDAAAFYDGAQATLDAHASRDRRELARAEASLTIPLEGLTAGVPAAKAITAGSATVNLWNLALADVAAFGDRQIGGHVAGKIALEGLGKDPSLDVELVTNDLTIGPALAFREGLVSVHTRRAPAAPGASVPEATALASVRLVDRAGGRLDASGYVNIGWKSGLLPAPLEQRPADLFARFQRFRLATLEPFVAGTVRELDGLLDGDVRVGWGRLDQAAKGAIDADLRVTGGKLYLPQLGQELRLAGEDGAPLRIVADRTGKVSVTDMIAEGNSGKVRASFAAQLDGISLRTASGKLTIAENEALPATVEGVEIGEVWGTIDLTANQKPIASTSAQALALAPESPVPASPAPTPTPAPVATMLAIDIHSKDLHLKIPSATTSRDVQSLDENPEIQIVSHTLHPVEDVATSPSNRRIQVAIRLEDMVIEGTGIRITLSTFEKTPPTITLTDKARGTGDVRLLRGTVEVYGRKFELDQGTIHLREQELSDPYVNVSAHWNGPDGSTIFVDYVGELKPITRQKLRIRSDPPRTQQEALAFLITGSESGALTTTGSSGGAGNAVQGAAVSVGGDLAAQQFNALLSGIAPLKGFSTRFGTSDSGALQGSLVYQVGDTVTALATAEAPSAAGSSSTTGTSTAPGATLSVDWRFYKNWLIRATVGTSADIPMGEVDLLWQYRY